DDRAAASARAAESSSGVALLLPEGSGEAAGVADGFAATLKRSCFSDCAAAHPQPSMKTKSRTEGRKVINVRLLSVRRSENHSLQIKRSHASIVPAPFCRHSENPTQ